MMCENQTTVQGLLIHTHFTWQMNFFAFSGSERIHFSVSSGQSGCPEKIGSKCEWTETRESAALMPSERDLASNNSNMTYYIWFNMILIL